MRNKSKKWAQMHQGPPWAATNSKNSIFPRPGIEVMRRLAYNCVKYNNNKEHIAIILL